MAKKSEKSKKNKSEKKIAKSGNVDSTQQSILLTKRAAIEPSNTPTPRYKRNEFHNSFLGNASILLSIAAGIGVLLGILSVALPDGKAAVGVMGGIAEVQVPLRTAQWAFMLDILFPMFYGSGLVLLISAFQTRGNRPVIRLVLTAILVGVIADLAENALGFKSMTGGEFLAVQFAITAIKYGSLVFAGIIAASVFPKINPISRLVSFVLGVVFPLLIALSISGIGGEGMQIFTAAMFPVILILLAVFSQSVLTDKHA